MNSHRTNSLRRLRIAGAAALALLALGAVAPAANADTVHTGNRCTSFFYANYLGSQTCVNRVIPNASSVSIQAGAHDYARDGYSAVNYTQIYRVRNGRWEPISWFLVTNSSGVNTTRLSDYVGVKRIAGTQIGVTMQSCSWDGSRSRYVGCTGHFRTLV